MGVWSEVEIVGVTDWPAGKRPLRIACGSKEEMTKMTNKKVVRGCLAVLGGIVLCAVSFSLLAAPSPKLRIIQTNSAGDNVHIIDPVTNKVVGVIEGIEVNHGAAVAPDGTRLYVSNEAESTLDVVDGQTLKV